jgi:hypothetical protein
MTEQVASIYPARLEVDYPDQHDRVTTLFREFLIIPIAIVLSVLTAGFTQTAYNRSGEVVRTTSGALTATHLLRRLSRRSKQSKTVSARTFRLNPDE